MDAKTYLAIAELIQAAAHFHGLTGPVQFTVCPDRDRFSRSRTTTMTMISTMTMETAATAATVNISLKKTCKTAA